MNKEATLSKRFEKSYRHMLALYSTPTADVILEWFAPHLRGEFPETAIMGLIAHIKGRKANLDDTLEQFRRLWNGGQEATKSTSSQDSSSNLLIPSDMICGNCSQLDCKCDKVCPTCGGSGEEVCGGCSGGGKKRPHLVVGNSATCRINISRPDCECPKVKCWHCSGSGKQPCPDCTEKSKCGHKGYSRSHPNGGLPLCCYCQEFFDQRKGQEIVEGAVFYERESPLQTKGIYKRPQDMGWHEDRREHP